MLVPAKNIHRIPNDISFEEAAMTEALVCCIQTVLEKIKITPDDNILIAGPRCIDLLRLQLVKACGVQCIVIGATKDADRLKSAEKLEANIILNTSDKKLTESIVKYCDSISPNVILQDYGAELAIELPLNII